MIDEINLQIYLNHLRSAVAIAKPDGKIVYKNAAFDGLFSRVPNTVNRNNLLEIIQENDLIIESFKKVCDVRGIYYLRETMVKLFKLPERAMDVETFPIIGFDGSLLAASIVFYDRVGQAHFHQHQKRVERIGYLKTIASGLAHEIKNPLSGIKGACQLLTEELNDNSDYKEYVEIILKEVVRVNRLMEDLLHFTKPRKLQKKRININQILQDIVKLQKTVEKENIIFETQFDPSLPKIMGDNQALSQVFLNFVKNARQAISGAGQVTIKSRIVTEFGLRMKNKKRRQVIGVDIQDTGKGIDDETLPNIFVPFYTTKPQGTGLGLALCHQIIEEHEGDIEVKSQRGKGTTFSVYLPI